MRQNEVQRHLARYQREIEHLGYLLDRAKNALPTDFEDYRHYTNDAARMAERLTCRLRNLVVETCFATKKEVMEQAAQEHGIVIAQENGWVKITLPGLLPSKKTVPVPLSRLLSLPPLWTIHGRTPSNG